MPFELSAGSLPWRAMRFRASEAAVGIGAELVGPDVDIDGASFDSRALTTGQLFVPIVAERDGHDFIAGALERGASAYLTAHEPVGGTALRVADTNRALLDLGRWARGRLADQVVGITGSVGKTTTKDLVAAALGSRLRVAANERSFNNDQGLPITILNAPDDTEIAVLEMGMRGFGEIARLCDVGRPTIGLVTVVGEAHTERVGGLEGVARAKGELIEALPPTGVAVLNADDHRVLAMRSRAAGVIVTYGESVEADVRITDLVLDEMARPRFTAVTPWGTVDVALAQSGAHMASNAAAAIAVCGAAGVSPEDAARGLATAQLSAMRMETTRLASGALLVNDAYNANPTSMSAALESLAAMTATRRIAVVGVMAEIEEPAVKHRAIADLAVSLGIELITVGTDLYGVAPVDDPVAAIGSLTGGEALLVKGSRVAGLERVAVALLAQEV